jgi:hypothetical protein
VVGIEYHQNQNQVRWTYFLTKTPTVNTNLTHSGYLFPTVCGLSCGNFGQFIPQITGRKWLATKGLARRKWLITGCLVANG